MTFSVKPLTLRVLSTLLCSSVIAACGGGGGSTSSADTTSVAGLVVTKGGTPVSAPTTAPTTGTGTTTPTTPTAPVDPVTPVTPSAPSTTLAVVTDVRLQNFGTTTQTSVPVTFGQVFAVGDVKATDILTGRLEDNTLLPLQMVIKAKHADGSVRHAIFSTIVPTIAASTTRTMSLAKNATATTGSVAVPADLLAAGFTASASATVAGVKYSASADQLLKAGAKATWLAGPIANEWLVSAPLTTAAGVAHPHLTARFAVRYYGSIKKARVDVTIENNWAFQPSPQNFTYDAEVQVGGKSVYTKAGLVHATRARWRKLFWWGGDAPTVDAQLNSKYLIASRAVPNYDPTVTISAATLARLGSNVPSTGLEPMSVGINTGYMPTTGAHDDIGILPMWTSAYVVTMDKRARDATLNGGDGAASFAIHFRDQKTDRPVSLSNYPYMTIAGNYGDTWNPTKNTMENFPVCAADCTTPYGPDISHQPSMDYVPYMVTGDYFYLEEMQFWAMYDTFVSNPNYRNFAAGLIVNEQLRGQAWAMRTLAQAAYITPDADLLKTDLVTMLNNNLDWYNTTYSNNASANKLGVPTQGYSLAYGDSIAVAPWMDDFFTSAIGHTADLGFDKAKALLAWKAKFPVGRMTAPGLCWVTGAPYGLTVRDTSTSPVYDTLLKAYTQSFGAAFMALPCASPAMETAWSAGPVGDMGGISDGYMGYPSNMQPALAYSVDSGITNAKAAWTLFMGRTVKPDYTIGNQFAIVPR